MKNKRKQQENNPFFDIVHDGDETILISKEETKKIKDLTKKLIKDKEILIVVGRAGSGKTLVELEITKNIPKNYKKMEFVFGVDIINELRCVTTEKILKKNLIVFVDRMELAEAFDEKKLKKVIDLIIETSKAGVCYVISCDPETLARMYCISDKLSKMSTVHNVPGLTFEQAKKLVVSRLNMDRAKKSNSLTPFTESQIKNIWQTSKGNPRMILLLCANLYSILRG